MIISDSSVIILLAKLNKLEILKRIYGKVNVPEIVYKEITIKASEEIENIKNASSYLIETKLTDDEKQKAFDLRTNEFPKSDKPEKHMGECQAIVLAERINLKNSIVLLDDKKAKNICFKRNILCTGTIGIIQEAHKQNFLSFNDAFYCINELQNSINKNKWKDELYDTARKIIQEQEKSKLLNFNDKENNMADEKEGEKKEYNTLAGYIVKGNNGISIQEIKKKDGTSFETAKYSLCLVQETTDKQKVFVNCETSSEDFIKAVKEEKLRVGSNIAVSGQWTKNEREGKTYVTFRTTKDFKYLSTAESCKNAKKDDYLTVAGGVTKLASFKIKKDDNEIKGYSINLIVDGKVKDENGEYNTNHYINLKTVNPEQVEFIERNIKVGNRLLVQGFMKEAKFTDKDGNEKNTQYLDISKQRMSVMLNANIVETKVHPELAKERDSQKEFGKEKQLTK